MFLFLIEAAYLLQFKENCIEVAKKLINADAIKATEKLFVLRRSTTEVHVTLTGLIYFVMPKARWKDKKKISADSNPLSKGTENKEPCAD